MIKKNKIFLFLITGTVLLTLSGCGTKKTQEYTRISLPEVGTIATQNVGEELVSQKLRSHYPGLIIPRNYQAGKYTLLKGTYKLDKTNEKGQWFEVRTSKNDNEDVLIRKSDGYLCVDNVCQKLDYSIKDIPFEKKNSFQQTLLYNGKIGSIVAISYREFNEGVARPAFTNEVTYDLEDSKTIGYKGARIEVISATNTEITYKVISGFE